VRTRSRELCYPETVFGGGLVGVDAAAGDAAVASGVAARTADRPALRMKSAGADRSRPSVFSAMLHA
jgi:hypothetical protein